MPDTWENGGSQEASVREMASSKLFFWYFDRHPWEFSFMLEVSVFVDATLGLQLCAAETEGGYNQRLGVGKEGSQFRKWVCKVYDANDF